MSTIRSFAESGNRPSRAGFTANGNQAAALVLLVDDHALVRAGLRSVLEATGAFECDEAPSAEQALALLAGGLKPLVAVLDFALPGMDGLDAIACFRRAAPAMRVLLLSMQPEEQLAARALRMGAFGYISKSSPSSEVLKAVRELAAGNRYISAQFAARLAAELATPDFKCAHHDLSEREFEVFRLIAEGKPVGEIAQALRLSVKTVSTYRQRLMEKLGFETNYQIIRYAIEHGLIDSRAGL